MKRLAFPFNVFVFVGLLLTGIILPHGTFAQTFQYPDDHNMIDITQYPGFPRAQWLFDNESVDVTTVIQAALSDTATPNRGTFGNPKLLYFPAGVYLVSDSLLTRNTDKFQNSVTLIGQGPQSSILKLVQNSPGFDDPENPKALYRTHDNNGNEAFKYNVWRLGVEISPGNPGAIALDFIVNNRGSIRDVSISSPSGAGYAGIEMTRKHPGPGMLKNVAINGFDYGINIGQGVYSMTIESLTLENQNIAGIRNKGNKLAIRDLVSSNSVSAIDNDNGSLVLLEADLHNGSSTKAAISLGDNSFFTNLYARDLHTTGYYAAVEGENRTSFEEFNLDTFESLFPSQTQSIRLEIEETPEYHNNSLVLWSKIDKVDADGHAPWDSDSLEAAMVSSNPVAYFPRLSYPSHNMTATVSVPTTLKKIVGFEYHQDGMITYVIDSGDISSDPIIFEGLSNGVRIEHKSSRTVVIKNSSGIQYVEYPEAEGATVFIEDVGMIDPTFSYVDKVYARQWNSEKLDMSSPNIINVSADLWILGIKTEGGATIIENHANARTEVLGGFVLPNVNSPLPAFENLNGDMSVQIWNAAFGTNYSTLIRDTQGNTTKDLAAGNIFGGGSLSYTSVNGFAQSSFLSGGLSIPGRIEAEDYDVGGAGVAYQDSSSSSNSGGAYRSDGVDVYPSTDIGGGFTISTRRDEWTEYTVENVAADDYYVQIRYSSPSSTPSAVELRANGKIIGHFDLIETANGEWRTENLGPISISEEDRIVLRITTVNGSPAINWIDFIDDGVNEHQVTDDTYVANGSGALTNYGSLEWMHVRNGSGIDERVSLIKFDLDEVTPSANRVTLRVRSEFIPFGVASVTAFEVDNDIWDESTVTWATRPALGNSLGVQTFDKAGEYLYWDVTDFVNAQKVGDGFASFGFRRNVNTTAGLETKEGGFPATLIVQDDPLNISGPKVIRSAEDENLVLTAEGFSNNSIVSKALFRNGTDQKWSIEKTTPDGFYLLRLLENRRRLECYDPTPAAGDEVTIFNGNGSDWQKWLIEDLNDGTFRITGKYNPRVMQSSGTSSGSIVSLEDWDGNLDQRWVLDLP